MQPIGVPLSFVFRRTSEAPRGARPKAVSDGARPVVAAAVERASIRPSPPPPAKPRQRLSSLVPPASGQPLASPVGEFDEIARLADAGQHREARAACERQLAARGPSATVFYWLGHTVFMNHFQAMARGHFVVRRLERHYGKDVVRDAYALLPRRG